MNLQNPIYLIGLLVPAACSIYLLRKKRLQWRNGVLIAALVFGCIAAARPFWGFDLEKTATPDVDLILAFDVSQSMFCETKGMRRINEARQFGKTILQQFAGVPAAIIYFAGDAQIGSPSTTDHRSLNIFIDSIAPGIAAVAGTKAQPLTNALKEVMDQSSHKRKIVMLFSDGEFFDSPGSLRSWLGRNPDVSLLAFICGAGSSMVPDYDLKGYFPDANSNVHPETMRSLSPEGKAYEISGNRRISPAALALMVRGDVQHIVQAGKKIPHERSTLFLAITFALLCLHQLWPLLKSLGNPEVFNRAMLRKAAPAALVLASLLLSSGMKPAYRSEYKEALKEMDSENFEQAEKILNKLRREEKAGEVLIALGNIAMKRKDYDSAISLYSEAVKDDPLNDIARWNWEVALKHRQQSQQSPPPPPKPEPRPVPETKSSPSGNLLDYFDEQEKEQMQDNNSRPQSSLEIAW